MVGMACILFGVVAVSYGKPNEESLTDGVKPLNTYYFNMAIMFSLIIGFEFSTGMVILKVFLRNFKFPPLQLNFDASAGFAIVWGPYLAY